MRAEEIRAQLDKYRAAVEAVKALLPDSPPFGHVRVVDVWDALHDVTEHECATPAERSGWDHADVADFLARDRAQRAAATHEYRDLAGDGQECIVYVEPKELCGMPRDHPIHQATPEETTPEVEA